ncbi:hypothetical protein BZG36_01901 [Bifiguratus adelaidae]|uniref:Uncharacterized protein n=1 Tax=Bifiguratus adelaidae TaxID=1938954 RepID=A0A261Y4I6_9FUNG|nr:hypothetical protein BZG36_01901 [Bifiguratus adelaidae]
MELYTDADPDYKNTPLKSPIPPPSLETVPQVRKSSDFSDQGRQRDRYLPGGRSDYDRRYDYGRDNRQRR